MHTESPALRRQQGTSRRVDLPPFKFWETRSGAGTPIVLIHGLGGSSDWWRRNVPELEQHHLVAAVDLVGFGRNRFFLKRSALPLTFVEISALLARWIRSSFEQPVHLVGNSMGGHIAIHIAAQYPELVRSLVLVNSTGIPFALKPGQHVANLVIPRGMLGFLQILARDLFRGGATSIALAFARLLRDDARSLLKEIKQPILLLWGGLDPLVPLSYANKILEEVPNGRLVVIPRASHVPMWQNPEAFNRELLKFVDEVDGSPPLPRNSPNEPRPFSWGIAESSEGIAFRHAGTGPAIVLIHGLGMSSAYFVHLAQAIFERGFTVVAPDIPGFGVSARAPAMGPDQQAAALAAWADRLKLRDVVWAGHSTGCNVVSHIARSRPDLVRSILYLAPLWSRSRHPMRHLGLHLVMDAFREPFTLYPIMVRSYARAGLRRWFRTFLKHRADLRQEPSEAKSFRMLAGRRDHLVDRQATLRIDPHAILDLPGAHAMHFSYPDQCAEAMIQEIRDQQRGGDTTR